MFGDFEFLRWYGIFWMLGIIAGSLIARRIYQWEAVPLIDLDKVTVYVMVGAIIGARLGHVLFYDPGYYLSNPVEILPFRVSPSFEFTGLSGLASHGGIIGALLALYLYSRKFDKNYWWLLDRLMIAGVVLGGFIRLGNLMNSEIVGIPADVPWAFVFVRVDEIPRHAAQLYEAIFYFVTGIALYQVWRSRKFYSNDGFIFGLGMVLIFVQRFFVEFIKEDQVAFESDLAFNMGQMLSIPLVLVGIFLAVWSVRRQSKA